MTSKADDARVVIGRVAGAFGLRGEVKVATSDPSDFRPGLAVRASVRSRPGAGFRKDDDARDMVVASMRAHKDRLLVRFEGVDDATAAGALHGRDLSALARDLPELPPDTYRDDDLIGMRVTDARLGDLGTVTSVAHYPHADMLVVGGRALLVPMIAAYQVKVDAGAATISTSLPEGFEDL